MSITPGDPQITTALVQQLNAKCEEFNAFVAGWQEAVNSIVMQLENAGTSEQLPDGGHTGQVPEGFAVVDDDEGFSTESTESSTDLPYDERDGSGF